MFKVIPPLLLLLCTILAALKQNNASVIDVRIIGGHDANIADYPYHASVEYLTFQQCAGAIISRIWILTAANCIHRLAIEFFMVRVGSELRNQGGQLINVTTIISHYNFSASTYDYDVALIQLAEPIKLSKDARIVGLPNNGDIDMEGVVGNVTGWGIYVDGGVSSTTLQVMEVPVMGHSVCKRLYSSYQFTERMFCAGYWEGGVDSCTGDDGGPFVSNSVLFGLVSWRLKPYCVRPQRPTVYTNVGVIRDWITEITGI